MKFIFKTSQLIHSVMPVHIVLDTLQVFLLSLLLYMTLIKLGEILFIQIEKLATKTAGKIQKLITPIITNDFLNQGSSGLNKRHVRKDSKNKKTRRNYCKRYIKDTSQYVTYS